MKGQKSINFWPFLQCQGTESMIPVSLEGVLSMSWDSNSLQGRQATRHEGLPRPSQFFHPYCTVNSDPDTGPAASSSTEANIGWHTSWEGGLCVRAVEARAALSREYLGKGQAQQRGQCSLHVSNLLHWFCCRQTILSMKHTSQNLFHEVQVGTRATPLHFPGQNTKVGIWTLTSPSDTGTWSYWSRYCQADYLKSLQEMSPSPLGTSRLLLWHRGLRLATASHIQKAKQGWSPSILETGERRKPGGR